AALHTLKEKGTVVAGIHAFADALEKVAHGDPPASVKPEDQAAWRASVGKAVEQLRALEKEAEGRIGTGIARFEAVQKTLDTVTAALKLQPREASARAAPPRAAPPKAAPPKAAPPKAAPSKDGSKPG